MKRKAAQTTMNVFAARVAKLLGLNEEPARPKYSGRPFRQGLLAGAWAAAGRRARQRPALHEPVQASPPASRAASARRPPSRASSSSGTVEDALASFAYAVQCFERIVDAVSARARQGAAGRRGHAEGGMRCLGMAGAVDGG